MKKQITKMMMAIVSTFIMLVPSSYAQGWVHLPMETKGHVLMMDKIVNEANSKFKDDVVIVGNFHNLYKDAALKEKLMGITLLSIASDNSKEGPEKFKAWTPKSLEKGGKYFYEISISLSNKLDRVYTIIKITQDEVSYDNLDDVIEISHTFLKTDVGNGVYEDCIVLSIRVKEDFYTYKQ